MVLSNHITIKTERNVAKTYKYKETEPLKPISNNLLDLLKSKQKRDLAQLKGSYEGTEAREAQKAWSCNSDITTSLTISNVYYGPFNIVNKKNNH